MMRPATSSSRRIRLKLVVNALALLIAISMVAYVMIALKMNPMKDAETTQNGGSIHPRKMSPVKTRNSKQLHSTRTEIRQIATENGTPRGKSPIEMARETTESVESSHIIASENATTTLCFMSQDCIFKTAKSFARAFPFRFDRNWIVPPDSDAIDVFEGTNHTNAGILYVKNFKAASTTTAGVAFRMAYHVSTEGTGGAPSSTKFNPHKRHKPAWVKAHHTRGNHYNNRYRKKSFLFTSVREPSSRAMSRIFYTSITQKGEKPTDKNILAKLRWNQLQFGAVSHMGGGYQVRYVSMHKTLPTSWEPDRPEEVYDPEGVHTSVAEIFQDYDFILVAERLDESMVTMALLLGLDVRDVLVQSAKVGASSKYLYFTTNKKKIMKESCMPYVKTFVSPIVQDHLNSLEWHAKNYGDYLLHAAANISLDMTMDMIGRDKVDVALKEYRRLSQKAKQLCTNETIYHCADDGTPQRHLSKPNCYEDDSGCGYQCVDRMLRQEEGAKDKT